MKQHKKAIKIFLCRKSFSAKKKEKRVPTVTEDREVKFAVNFAVRLETKLKKEFNWKKCL